MRTKEVRNSFLLVFASLIWGIAFVAQSEGGDAVGAFSFNGIRSFIGAAVLLPVIYFLEKRKGFDKKTPPKNQKLLWIGGILCGIALFIASSLQQLGITMGTAAGKAGFLTACYILIVPVLGLFFHKRCGVNIWIGVLLTLFGLYFLCINETFSFQKADILILLCALFFSVQILLVDYFSPRVEGVKLACIEFLVVGVLSLFPMFFWEMGHSAAGIKTWAMAFTTWKAWIPILYAGVLSCGVAYTLQVIGQNGLNPALASMLMSLESTFSVLAGWVILHQRLSSREIIGCVLIFAAIALAQIPVRKYKKS